MSEPEFGATKKSGVTRRRLILVAVTAVIALPMLLLILAGGR